MAYSDAVLQRARARLAQARQDREQENDRRIRAIYEAQPRLKEIDRQLRSTMAQVMAVTFQKGGDPTAAMEEIRAKNLELHGLRRLGLRGRAHVRVPERTLPPGTEKGTFQPSGRPGNL